MTTLRLRGQAHRADCREQPLGPGVTVPETVPVFLESSLREGPIGIAALTRGKHGIWADVTIDLDGPHGDLMGKAIIQGTFRKMWPVFAISVADAVCGHDGTRPSGMVVSGKVVNLSLSRTNSDPGLPPYEQVLDAEGDGQ